MAANVGQFQYNCYVSTRSAVISCNNQHIYHSDARELKLIFLNKETILTSFGCIIRSSKALFLETYHIRWHFQG